MKNPEYIKAFGEHLREIRNERGWSQQQLADTANIPKITVQRIELAKTCASIDVIFSIANALEVDMIKLFDF